MTFHFVIQVIDPFSKFHFVKNIVLMWYAIL